MSRFLRWNGIQIVTRKIILTGMTRKWTSIWENNNYEEGEIMMVCIGFRMRIQLCLYFGIELRKEVGIYIQRLREIPDWDWDNWKSDSEIGRVSTIANCSIWGQVDGCILIKWRRWNRAKVMIRKIYYEGNSSEEKNKRGTSLNEGNNVYNIDDK